MAFSMNPSGRDQIGTYIRQSRFTEEELVLLQQEEQMMTAVLGGVLPEQPDPTSFESVLDVGCGTGQWLIEVAQTYPGIAYLVGVDISKQIVEYAQAQATSQQVADRVQFRVMDALSFLDFPPDTFNLINIRFGASFLRTWDWDRLLHDFKRIARSNGVIRIVEANWMESNNPAQEQQANLLLQAFYRSGHAFTLQKDGMTSGLVPLLRQSGFQNIQTADRILHYHKETLQGQFFLTYIKQIFQSIQPFEQKWNRHSSKEIVYKRMQEDMQQPGFEMSWKFLTLWAKNPPKE